MATSHRHRRFGYRYRKRSLLRQIMPSPGVRSRLLRIRVPQIEVLAVEAQLVEPGAREGEVRGQILGETRPPLGRVQPKKIMSDE